MSWRSSGYSLPRDTFIGQDMAMWSGTAHAHGQVIAGGHRRLAIMAGLFGLAFAALSGRLVDVALLDAPDSGLRQIGTAQDKIRRPNLTDRYGRLLATDLVTVSLYANATQVPDIDVVASRLTATLPILEENDVRVRLETQRPFIWLARKLTPAQHYKTHNLGIPGLGFVKEIKRVYPSGPVASHVLGYVDVDNKGIAGIEKYIDTRDDMNSGSSVALTLDLAVQHVVRDELKKAMEEFRSSGAMGLLMDVHNGEIIAMVSLPDFDPNNPNKFSDGARFNRATLGVYEMGSTFKAFTTAIALEAGTAKLTDKYDATEPIYVSGYAIRDFHPEKRWLTVPEVFIHSSNIGTARMIMDVGSNNHQTFLKRLGLLNPLHVELPEVGAPLIPKRWRTINSVTISYGYGMAVSPLQLMSSMAVLVNGGFRVQPTFVRERDQPQELAGEWVRIVSRHTSEALQSLMKMVVEQGTGRQAATLGYSVIGKTGTAEKVVNGRYEERQLLTSFFSAFPAEAPRYGMLILLDDPHGNESTYGFATAGWTAAPVTGRIVARIAPLLGLRPKDQQAPSGLEAIAVSYARSR
ncbi:MAG: penicillin-binding protein 2 [Parvularculales bacterium]